MKKHNKEITKLAKPIKEILSSKGLAEEQIETFKKEVERNGDWYFDTVTIRDYLSIFLINSETLAGIIHNGLDNVFYGLTENDDVIEILVETMKECPITTEKFLKAQTDIINFMMKWGCGLLSEEEKRNYRVDFYYLYRDLMEWITRKAHVCPSYLKKTA